MNLINSIAKSLSFLLILLLSQTLLAVPPPASFIAKFPVFSKSNNKLIYLNSQNNNRAYTITQMNTQTGKITKKVPLKMLNGLNAFAATPDGFKILAANPHGIGVIHNGTGKVLRTLPHPSKIKDWRFTPVQSHDGVLLAIPSIGPQAQQIFLIHTGSGKVIRSINLSKDLTTPNHLPIIRSIGFNQDRHAVAYLQQDQTSSSLHVYDIYQKKQRFTIKLPKPYYDYGKISFSKNGAQILLYNYDKQGITLIDAKSRSAKILNYDYSSFAGFTADDKSLLIIQPIANLISIQNINTGAVKRTNIRLRLNNGQYGWGAVQSANRAKIVLPFTTRDYPDIDQFLLIDGNSGKVLRALKAN